MKKAFILLISFILTTNLLFAQKNSVDKGFDAITLNALKSQTGFLASEWTEGRETGKKGAYLSADYIASMLQLFDVKPGGDFVTERDPGTRRTIRKQSYFQNFSLMTSAAGDEQTMAVAIFQNGSAQTLDFELGTDFMITPSYPGGTVEAPVIFVGYGYKDDKAAYDDFAGLDVKGKIILRLAGLPSLENVDSSPYASYRASRQKDELAYKLGVAGILDVNPNNIDGSAWAATPDFLISSPSERGTRRARVRYQIPAETIGAFTPKASITFKAAKAILTGSGIDMDGFIAGTSSSLKPLKGFKNSIRIKTTVKSSFVKVRNVVGYIEGKNKDEVIVIGAHYDHLGISEGYIYNGADDNASGTVGVLTIARAISATGEQPEKTIVFALWTGEEKGLLGSRYYADNPTFPLESIRINVNFDMISRYITDEEPNKVTMMYSPSVPELKDLTIKHINDYNLELEPVYLNTDSPPGGTDHLSFINKGIPYLRYKPGHREEYHSPADEVSTLDWDIMEKIVKLTYLNIWHMVSTDW